MKLQSPLTALLLCLSTAPSRGQTLPAVLKGEVPDLVETGGPYASQVKTKNAAGQDVGVMHACGHDIHITTMIGTARALVALKKQWHGTLMLVGQPSEELVDG